MAPAIDYAENGFAATLGFIKRIAAHLDMAPDIEIFKNMGIDKTYFLVADAEGNTVSWNWNRFKQPIYWLFFEPSISRLYSTWKTPRSYAECMAGYTRRWLALSRGFRNECLNARGLSIWHVYVWL